MSETTEAPIKTVPANLEAEQAVLGSLLIDPDAIVKIASSLRASDFYRERHEWIYSALLTLHERREPADFVTLVDELERNEQLESVGGPAYVTELINSTPTAIYVDHYARIVERTATLRRLIGAAGKIAELAYDESHEVDEVVDRAEQIIFGVSESRIHRDLTPILTIMADVVDQIDFLARNQNRMMGVPTGFVELDKMLGGFQKSDLIIVAGRPGMGKSSLGLSIAQNAARRHDARVAIFSLEMSSEQVVQRLLSVETAIDSHRLRLGQINDEDWPILMEAANTLAATNIFIDDTPGASVMEIRTKARRLYAERGIDLILVDYMQLMSGSSGGRGENRQQEISYISRSLKELARGTERACHRPQPAQPRGRKPGQQQTDALRPARERLPERRYAGLSARRGRPPPDSRAGAPSRVQSRRAGPGPDAPDDRNGQQCVLYRRKTGLPPDLAAGQISAGHRKSQVSDRTGLEALRRTADRRTDCGDPAV